MYGSQAMYKVCCLIVISSRNNWWRRSSRGHPPPSLECTFCLSINHRRTISRMRSWERNVLLRLSGWNTWLNPLKTLHKLLRFWWTGAEIYHPREASSVQFLCILNRPPTNLERTASLFCLSLPSVYLGQFANQQQFKS